MDQSYMMPAGLDDFAAAREQFDYLVKNLGSREMAGWEHSDVESWIWEGGTELQRRLLQGYMDVQGRNEVMLEEVNGADGAMRNHRRQDCERSLMSLFGALTHQKSNRQ